MQTKKVNVFETSKRKILCIANEHDYFGDGTIILEEELEVGRQYIFVRGGVMPYGSMAHLEENYRVWLREKLNEAEIIRKEGGVYSL